ncbi:MAG TPA: cell division protein FtsH, partial [Patescibacteria group bacterium]|nr:cell division protein FtsH [Patescibacteria group bacterium]
TGPSNDLQKATKLAKSIVTEYGMSDSLGPRTFGEREEMIFLGREIHEQRDYSDQTAEKIDLEMNRIIAEALERATTIIRDDRVKLETIVAILLKQEKIEKEEFEAIFADETDENGTKNTAAIAEPTTDASR